MTKREPSSNLRFTCAEHSAKADPKYAKKPTDFFVGKFVKKGFAAIHPQSGKPTLEHMWVKVVAVKEGALIGQLDNDPVYCMDLAVGDTVTVRLDEIEDVLA